jgi:hypothetical protein
MQAHRINMSWNGIGVMCKAFGIHLATSGLVWALHEMGLLLLRLE